MDEYITTIEKTVKVETDKDGMRREIRQHVFSDGQSCTECERPITWRRDTDVWTVKADTWEHHMYGEQYAFCECGVAFHGMPDGGIIMLDLRKTESLEIV